MSQIETILSVQGQEVRTTVDVAARGPAGVQGEQGPPGADGAPGPAPEGTGLVIVEDGVLGEPVDPADLPISDATQTALDGKADAALQRVDYTEQNVIMYHDEMTGDNATRVAAGTRTCVPGPGTWTLGLASNQSYVRVENGVMRHVLSPFATGATQDNLPLTPVAAGMAMRARLVTSFQPGYSTSKTKIGFALTTNAGANTRGVISFQKDSAESHVRVFISAGVGTSDASLYNAGLGPVLAGEECEVVVYYKTLQHQQYFIQTAVCGCPVGSERWHMLGETFMDLSASASVYPYVLQEQSGVTEVHEVTVYSQWSPGNRAGLFDYSRTLQGVHIPTLARDPVTNLPILAWNTGTGHVGQGMSALRATVRLASGQWTSPTTILAAPVSPAGQCINSISDVNGVLWMIYWKSTNGSDGGVLYRRTLSINPSDGAVTLGTETALGISGSLNLNFSPIIRLASGRLMLPYHKGLEGSPNYNAYVAHSDDGGSTWTPNAISASIPAGMNVLVEPTIVIESDGAVGAYIRNQSGSIAYSRCTNPNASTPTWSTPRLIPAIPDPYSRSQVRKMADGQILLIGNDSKNYRRDVTIWRMGDNGVMESRTFIADWNPIEQTASVSQLAYPTLLEDGEDLVIAWTHQESGGGNLAVGIRYVTMRWCNPVAIEEGGAGRQDKDRPVYIRPVPTVTTIPYSTTPKPDLSKGSPNFAITLTASTATMAGPDNPMGYEEMKIIVTQGGAGNFTLAWNANYQMNGTTPTLRTTAGDSNIFVFVFNPVSQKWVLQSFN